jgi:hypothetical protein
MDRIPSFSKEQWERSYAIDGVMIRLVIRDPKGMTIDISGAFKRNSVAECSARNTLEALSCFKAKSPN